MVNSPDRASFRLMNESDNREVLDLINSTWIKGEIEILFTKEPDYIKANLVCGNKVQTVVGLVNDKIEILGNRCLKECYINGDVATLAYMSDLKISSNAKKIRALSDGYAFMKKQTEEIPATINIATIIEDNKQAKIALTWKNKTSTVPNYYDIGLLNTYFIFPIFPIKKSKIEIKKGNIDILDKIVEFLNEEGKKKQFYPKYTREYFLNLTDFNIEDFYVAFDNGDITGIMAKWEQTSFKQVIIKKYNGKMKFLKKIFKNILPDENKPIKQFYVSFVAIKNNDNFVFENLLRKIYADNRNYKYFSIILHEKDNLNKAMKNFLHKKYLSRLYITEYLSDNEIKAKIDERVPYLELATL